MKFTISFWASTAIILMSIQCAHQPSQQQKSEELVKWHGKMHVLSNSLSKLMPLTSSPRAFNDPKNRDAIDREIKVLREIAHKVDRTEIKPTNDPGLSYMAERFATNIDEVVHQLEINNRLLARRLLQQNTAHCINCHTSTDAGRSNLQLSALANLNGLTGLEQADFFIAVRDYDKALNKFDQVVNSPDALILNPHDMEAAAEKALAIAVRVKRDPALANEIVSRIIDAKWAPMYLRLNATMWKKNIEDWKREQNNKQLTNKEQFALAKRIMSQGWKVNASSPLSQAGLIHFLRASTILSNLLGQSPDQPNYAEFLYYAGLAAESLRNINLWTLQDGYYEECIRSSPKTNIAKKCYLRYEALQFSSYATEEATMLPRDVSERLRELKNLSLDPQGRGHDWEAWEMMGE